MTFWMPPPSTAARSRASTSMGKPISASMMRMMMALIHPPRKPASSPRITPMMAATATVPKPTMSAVLAP